jgi:hypothetical protein
MNKKTIFNSIKIIALGILLSAGISYAKPPAAAPAFPGGNPDNPVNVGPNSPFQTKSGSLVIGPLQVTGSSSFLGDMNIYALPSAPPGGPAPTGFNYKKNLENYLASFLKMFVPGKVFASVTNSCSPDFSQNPIVCVNSNTANPTYCDVNGFRYNPQTYSCAQPPATAPTIDLEAYTDYGDGTNVTITPTAYAELDWTVTGSGTVTCTASSSPVVTDWTTTAVNAQGFYGAIALGSSSKSRTRTYSLSCSNSIGTTNASAIINVLTPPATAANLYVSGKACLGNATVNGFSPTCDSSNLSTPASSLEVNGSIKVDYLQFGAPHKLCSNQSGVLVLCP